MRQLTGFRVFTVLLLLLGSALIACALLMHSAVSGASSLNEVVSPSAMALSMAAGVGFGLLLLMSMLFLPRSRHRRERLQGALAAVTVAAVSALAADANAQPAPTEELRNFPAEQFRVATDRQGMLNVEWPAVRPAGSFEAGLWNGFADDPLVLYRDIDGQRTAVATLVEKRYGGELFASVSVFDWAQLSLVAPVAVVQRRDLQSNSELVMVPELGEAGLGDLRVVPKFQLLNAEDHHIDVAVIPAFTLPMGSANDYFRESSATFIPELGIGRDADGFRIAANIGYRLRGETVILDLEVDDEVFYRLGAGYRLHKYDIPLEIDATLAGAFSSERPFDYANQSPLELALGPTYDFNEYVALFGAAGFGLVRSGYGTPDWRILMGVRVVLTAEQEIPDRDGDGIPDDLDECPDEPEDIDEFEDEDGCPDLDNDEDLVPDLKDGAPNDPEDRDGFEDEDGVPDPDNDGDGVPDELDKCPNVPGVPENKGCPVEKPPPPPPPPPPAPSDPDRDGDGVPDYLDNCPDEPGPVENQGCKRKRLAKIKVSGIELVDKVYFRTGRDVIETRSFPLLDDVADVLNNHPNISTVMVEGHTDSRGALGYNMLLSQRRAESVMRYLTRKGVAATRLRPVGFGPKRPIETNQTREGRAANRRVEFNFPANQNIKKKDVAPGIDTIDY